MGFLNVCSGPRFLLAVGKTHLNFSQSPKIGFPMFFKSGSRKMVINPRSFVFLGTGIYLLLNELAQKK